MDIKKKYENATGVNIDEQRILWDERGKGYYGEYLVFRELYLDIPGYYKLLFNVEIPNVNGTKTTEIDALMLHETGIYSIEVKHYKGTIYGKVEDQKWTQFFKTTDNSHFNNPVKQNEWHIAAIKSMFPASDASSYVVFTSDDCELKVTGSKPNTTICYLRELQYNLTNEIKRKQKIYSAEQLERMFKQLKPYSKIVNSNVTVDGETVPFTDYINQIRSDNNAVIQKKTEEQEAIDRKRKGTNVLCIILAILSIIGGICASIIIPQARINAVEQKYSEFFQKFEPARSVTIQDIDSSNLVDIADFQIVNSTDLSSGIKISFKLKNTGEEFHLGLSKESAIIIQTVDGRVIESTVYSSDLYGLQQMNSFLYRIQPGYYETIDSGTISIPGVSEEEVAYIKLTELDVYKEMSQNAVAEGAELTLFER